MSVLNIDPSLPSNPSPLFSDVTAARGDHLRSNNAEIWGNFADIDTKKANLASPTFTGGVSFPVWAQGVAYVSGQIVKRGQTLYICLSNHTAAASFINDFIVNAFWGNLTDCPGIIKEWASTTVPSGYKLCDGSAISRITYTDLYTLLGTIWGVGDNLTTFNIPDLRGVSIAGAGAGVLGSTPETFALSGFYDDVFQSHDHYRNNANQLEYLYIVDGTTTTWFYPLGVTGATNKYFTGLPGQGRIGTVTRGKVVAVNFIMKVI